MGVPVSTHRYWPMRYLQAFEAVTIISHPLIDQPPTLPLTLAVSVVHRVTLVTDNTVPINIEEEASELPNLVLPVIVTLFSQLLNLAEVTFCRFPPLSLNLMVVGDSMRMLLASGPCTIG
jgi:hypothetical protein